MQPALARGRRSRCRRRAAATARRGGASPSAQASSARSSAAGRPVSARRAARASTSDMPSSSVPIWPMTIVVRCRSNSRLLRERSGEPPRERAKSSACSATNRAWSGHRGHSPAGSTGRAGCPPSRATWAGALGVVARRQVGLRRPLVEHEVHAAGDAQRAGVTERALDRQRRRATPGLAARRLVALGAEQRHRRSTTRQHASDVRFFAAVRSGCVSASPARAGPSA